MPNTSPTRREEKTMTVKPQIFRTQAEQDLLRHFEERFPNDDGGLTTLRHKAFAGLREAGLPHRRVEDYKYTDLKSLVGTIPDIGDRPAVEAARKALAGADHWGDVDRKRIVFADGYYFPELSDDDMPGIKVDGLAAALGDGQDVSGRVALLHPEKADASLDLNTAFMVDGVLIDIDESHDGAVALELVFLHVETGPLSQYVRSAVRVGKETSLTLLETHVGPDGVENHSNVAFEVFAGDGSKVTWIKLQRSGSDALHLGTTLTEVGADADFNHFTFTMGSKMSRSQSFVTFCEQGSRANLRGVTMLRNKEHADLTLLVDHAVPECDSQERFKAVIDDRAKGVFQGKIIVRPDAQKTDGQMMTQTLLLSDDAQVANKPELEIFADDVQCAHGATTGQIDEDLLFYLMARGIPREQARTLLVLAFIGETIEEIGNEAIEEHLEALSQVWLLGERAVL